VGSVSYLNAKPLIYGLEQSAFADEIEFSIDYPSRLAQQLINGEIDLGLVPVATMTELDNPHIVSQYCISAHRYVNSVCLFSEVPMEEIEEVFLDYQSRTSVRLAQVLFSEYWKKDVAFLQAPQDFIDHIKGPRAGVIIGDRALKYLSHFKYVYDLSEYWYQHTRKDFVFAAWIANKSLPTSFIHAFESANQLGFEHLETVIAQNPIDYYDLNKYYTEDILYKFDEDKKAGLMLFLQKLGLQQMPVFI